MYHKKISLERWRPVYYNLIIASLRDEFGCGDVGRITGEAFIQVSFYDASMLNADKMLVVLTFIKTDRGCDFTFIAASDYVTVFRWDASTESITVQRYVDFFARKLLDRTDDLPDTSPHPNP